MRFKIELSRRKKIIASILGIALVVAGVGFALGWFGKKADTPPPPPPKFYSQLTGEEVSEEVFKEPILGVMIENSEEARPQAGLDSAGVVFETVTEGGITRYLALYQEDLPKEIGPVRSVRPAFVNWLAGFDASVAHVGGSTKGLALIDQLDAKSLSQFRFTDPYRRVDNRAAPHNVYASTSALRDLQKKENHKTADIEGWPRSDDSPALEPQAPKIALDFSGNPIFAVEFRYDKASNSYTRYLAGAPHIDEATKKPITVKNVIVLRIKGNHSDNLQALGEGEALIFKDGNVVKAKWKQTTARERIKFVDEMGNEVSLNRGDSWISAVPIGRPVTY